MRQSQNPRGRIAVDGEAIEVRRGASSMSTPEHLTPRLRRRRAWTLPMLTLVAPGSAQIVAGNRRLGRSVLRGAVLAFALAVLAGIVYLVSPATLLGIITGPWFLAALTGVLVALAVVWAVLFGDALRLARLDLVPRGTRRLIALTTVLLMVVTSGALLAGARLVWATRTAVTGVFDATQAKAPVEGRYNILLIGSDAGKDRTGVRTDTLMLASVDAKTGDTAMFAFARDTENIDFREGSVMKRLMPQGWNCGDNCLLNGIYKWGTDHASEFPAGTKNPGALATKEAVEAISGLDVQYYAMVDLVGFRRFVDAVGGVNVVVGRRTPIGGGTSKVSGYIEPGEQRLDGYHALWYARSREGSSNYDRMARQRCVTTAMMHQLDPATVITKSQQIAEVAGGTIETDIPASDLGSLGALAVKARGGKMTQVNFTPPVIKPWDYDKQYVRDVVRKAIAGDPDPTGLKAKKAATQAPSTSNQGAGATGNGGASGSQGTDRRGGSGSQSTGSSGGGDDADSQYTMAVRDADGLICAVP